MQRIYSEKCSTKLATRYMSDYYSLDAVSIRHDKALTIDGNKHNFKPCTKERQDDLGMTR